MAKIATVSTEGLALIFTFASGAAVSIQGDQLPENIQEQALLFGLRTKLQNSYAGVKDGAEAEAAFLEQVEHLKSGEWNKGRAAGAGGGSASKGGRTVAAVVNLTGKSREEVLAIWEALAPAERTALTKRPQVAAEIARIKLEEAQKAAADASESGDDPLAGLFA